MGIVFAQTGVGQHHARVEEAVRIPAVVLAHVVRKRRSDREQHDEAAQEGLEAEHRKRPWN